MVGTVTMLDAKNETFDGDNFIFSAVVQGGEPKSWGEFDDGDGGNWDPIHSVKIWQTR